MFQGKKKVPMIGTFLKDGYEKVPIIGTFSNSAKRINK